MRVGLAWVALSTVLASEPCGAAGANTLQIGGTTFTSSHIEKWYVACTTDMTENKSSCGAELNAFDLTEPKHTKPTDIDYYFIVHANRVDIHVTINRGACASYIRIDGPHLKMNPATVIKLRGEKMNAPYTMERFQDVAGAGRVFFDDNNLSLQGIIADEGTLYIKTISANGSASFSVSTKGYRRVCQTILAREHELNSGR